MSDFIERSKHPEMTRMVEAMFNTPAKGVNYIPPSQAGHTVTVPRVPPKENGLRK